MDHLCERLEADHRDSSFGELLSLATHKSVDVANEGSLYWQAKTRVTSCLELPFVGRPERLS